MNGITDRLTDAMGAAADTVREEGLRPLAEPERRERRWRWRHQFHQSTWAAPLAAAVAVVLVIGLAVSLTDGLFGTRRLVGTAPLPTAPHRFYVAVDLDTEQPVIRSTATGKVVKVVPVPSMVASGAVPPVLASAGFGMFFLAAFQKGVQGEQIYEFNLNLTTGQVQGFGRAPGGWLPPGWAADALAVAPDMSTIAVGAYYTGPNNQMYVPNRSDQLVIINMSTLKHTVWHGGSVLGDNHFRVASLSYSFAGLGTALAVLGEWCRGADWQPGGEGCPSAQRQAQLREVNPNGHGSVLDGRLLLAQSARTYLAQAVIGPGGEYITAMVLHGRVMSFPRVDGIFPQDLSVVRFAAATGRPLSVLYQRRLGDIASVSSPMPDPLALSADATGQNLILNGGICNRGCTNGFNGWLRAGRLVPLLPTGFHHREAAEAW